MSGMGGLHKDCLQISLQVPSLPDRDAGLHQEIKQENYERDRRSEEEDEYEEEEEEDEDDGNGGKGGDGKGRLRICFDPELELPRLQEWFHQNQHPTRKQVQNQQGLVDAMASEQYGGFWQCGEILDNFFVT